MGGGFDKVNQEKNHRIVHQRTVYHEDGDRYDETRWSDFDGFYNFRTVERDGTFTAQDAQTVITNYLPAGTLVVDPSTGDTTGSTFVMPGPNDPWFFGTYTERRETRAGTTAVTEFCFDPVDRFLERTRVLAEAPNTQTSAAVRDKRDFLTVFEPAATGHVATEKRYGGDTQAAMDGVYASLCEMTLPASGPSYQREHTYVASVKITQRACPNGSANCSSSAELFWKQFDFDGLGRMVGERVRLPALTGIVEHLRTHTYDAQSRKLTESVWALASQSSVQATTFTYDALGRPPWATC